MQTATREPETFQTQQVAALAAGKQNHMWDFVELFYHEQGEEDSGYVTESYLQGLAAQQIRASNLTAWSSARNDPTLRQPGHRRRSGGQPGGFTGTPSFLIGKTGGALKKLEVAASPTPGQFETADRKAR